MMTADYCKFTEAELLSILKCKSLAELNALVVENTKTELLKTLIEKHHSDYQALTQSKRHKVNNAMLMAIDVSSIPVDIYWFTLILVGLGVTAVWFAGIAALVCVGIGIGAFYHSYQKNSAKMDNRQDSLALISLKNCVLDELIARMNPEGSEKLNPTQSIEKLRAQNSGNEIIVSAPSKTSSFLMGLIVSVIMTCTFFWAVTDVLATLGFVAAAAIATTPIGLAIGITIAIIMGIYFGVQYYSSQKNQNEIKSQYDHLSKINEDKVNDYTQLCQLKIQQVDEQTKASHISPLSNAQANAPISGGQHNSSTSDIQIVFNM